MKNPHPLIRCRSSATESVDPPCVCRCVEYVRKRAARRCSSPGWKCGESPSPSGTRLMPTSSSDSRSKRKRSPEPGKRRGDGPERVGGRELAGSCSRNRGWSSCSGIRMRNNTARDSTYDQRHEPHSTCRSTSPENAGIDSGVVKRLRDAKAR